VIEARIWPADLKKTPPERLGRGVMILNKCFDSLLEVALTEK
jgi:hypothetical protein